MEPADSLAKSTRALESNVPVIAATRELEGRAQQTGSTSTDLC